MIHLYFFVFVFIYVFLFSGSSLDISPLMGLKVQRTPPKKPPRPRAALNKTVPMNFRSEQLLESDSSSGGTQDTVFVENSDPGVMSPKSYLSMPSVKSFPRWVVQISRFYGFTIVFCGIFAEQICRNH